MTSFSIQKYLQIVLFGALLVLPTLTFQAVAQDALTTDVQTKATTAAQVEKEQNESTPPILLELYSAEDCTACIYADHMLYDAMKNDNVIALSCMIHDMSGFRSVDDKEYVSNENNEGALDQCLFRQWAYQSSRTVGEVTLSVPMFIVNGNDIILSNNFPDFKNVLEGYRLPVKNPALEIFMDWKDKNTITINLPQAPEIERANINASVWIIRYEDVSVKHIESGVNKGKVLRFSNVIKEIRHIAKWHGSLRSINVDVHPPAGGKNKGGYVVAVAAMVGSPILAVGKIADYPVAGDVKGNEPSVKATSAPETKKEIVVPSNSAPAAPAQ